MTEEKNGDGTYRKPADVEKIPEYATTVGIISALCYWQKTGHGSDKWSAKAPPDPEVPPGPYNWQLLSATPVLIEKIPVTAVDSVQRLGDAATVLLVWTWHRREKS
jgi:hypothetical protein